MEEYVSPAATRWVCVPAAALLAPPGVVGMTGGAAPLALEATSPDGCVDAAPALAVASTGNDCGGDDDASVVAAGALGSIDTTGVGATLLPVGTGVSVIRIGCWLRIEFQSSLLLPVFAARPSSASADLDANGSVLGAVFPASVESAYDGGGTTGCDADAGSFVPLADADDDDANDESE